jgi:L-ascorbate metabolism protein UlaG (beta-lactamase superfamily)
MSEPVNRTALFDPGTMSESALNVGQLEFLDDIIITHGHPDHMSVPLIKQLAGKFPAVRITATPEVVELLKGEGIAASAQPAPGMQFFDSPHEVIRPFYDHEPPQEIGVHYLDMLSDPGDSHSFTETKAILALPVQAPWGSANNAVKLGLKLRPQHILPIHDWHWSDGARKGTYDRMEEIFGQQGITFHKLETGVPISIDL